MFYLSKKIGKQDKVERIDLIKSEYHDKFTKPRHGHEKRTLEVVNRHRAPET